MHKLFHFILIFSSILVAAAVLDSRGRATPSSHETRSEEATVDVEDYLYSCLRQHHEIKDTRLPFEVYVQKLDGRKLIEPMLKHKNSRGEIDYVVRARDAELTVLREKRKLLIHLYQGRMRSEDSEGYFEKREVSFDLPNDFGPK